MGQLTSTLLAFNRGIVDRLGLARVDVKRLAMSAEEMWNFIPRVLGSMSIRPGWKYLGASRSNLTAKFIPFVFSVTDTHLLEITNVNMRVWRSDALVTRETVGTGVVNGDFTSDIASWTDNDEAGAASTWHASGYLQLLGDGTNAAIVDQAVTVSGGDASIEHALRISIAKGPVNILVGTVQGGSQLVRELSLGTGEHSLAFTPNATTFYIRFLSRLSRPVWVNSVSIESAGVFALTAPWATANLDDLRWDQSGDYIFVACSGVKPRMIQRWDIHSWSIVEYEPEDGPFRTENVTTKTLTPSALTGTITLTSSANLFRTDHVGALFRLSSDGQTVASNISVSGDATNAIRITGVDSSRVFTIILAGTWTGTVNLQRSLESDAGPWETVSSLSWTANTTETYDDGLDNQIAWYRINFTTRSTGTLTATLDYALGSASGVVRVTAFTDVLTVTADVLSDLGGTGATEVWAEGAWSTYRGWPSAVSFHEGRLWWAGLSKIWGSVTDAFDSFDPDYEGDAGPISRSLSAGPVDNINWLFSSQRLLIGADINEYAARSSSLDEPLTPTAFNVKATSDQGSAPVMPGRLDSRAIFVNRTGMRVFENTLSNNSLEYTSNDLCALVPTIGSPGVTRLAVQRQPDTRVHCVRSDGTVALLVIDKAEEVNGWCEIDTDGEVEDVVVLPAQSGVTDDYIYYLVKRTINGSTVRYLEKWSQSSSTIGGLGLGEPSLLNEYSDFEFSQTDINATYPDDTTGAFYNADTREIYAIGSNSDDIYIHKEATFTASPEVITGIGDIEPSGSLNIIGCMSKEGGYVWVSGDATPNGPIKVLNTATHELTNMGYVDLDQAFTVAAQDSPSRVWIGYGSTLRMFSPTIGTGTMGAATWTITNANFDFNSGVRPAIWDANNHLWLGKQVSAPAAVGTLLYQIVATTGAYAIHDGPVLGGATLQIKGAPAYDSATEQLYVIVADGGSSSPAYLYAYSGWATTPTANSGTWTQLMTFLAPGAYYGRWIHYDAVTDVLFMAYREDPLAGTAYVYRYTGTPKVLVDTVTVSLTDSSADLYPWDLQPPTISYQSNYGYVVAKAASGGARYLIKITYGGPQTIYDSTGSLIVEGSTDDFLNNLADSYVTYAGAPATSIAVAHLEGESVVVWANGVDLGTDSNYEQTYTVASGVVTLPEANTNVTVGLPYYARFKSAKLALQTQTEVLFGKSRRITELALVLADTHAKGIRFGPDYDNLDDRPEMDGGAVVDPDNIDTNYDGDMIQFPSTWATDLRVCLKAQAPRPCTVLAVKLVIEV